MLPILLLSILTAYAIIERLIVLQRSTKIPQRWMDAVKTKILEGDVQGVKILCAQKQYAIARIIKAGIKKLYEPTKNIAHAVENAAQIEVYKLEKNLALLGTISGAAPMLGFLGTVVGMIQAFMAMAQETNQISPKLLSGGIYEAMITTAAGLVVGIVANLGYNYLLTRIQKTTHRIEHAASQFIESVGIYSESKQHKKASEA
ncbi:MAG TPA: biopolymer transporter ExbB [Amoebophilaceae bacterium]|nr:biopolymer transporter ExbB [Amoebophilaceae bacterium]